MFSVRTVYVLFSLRKKVIVGKSRVAANANRWAYFPLPRNLSGNIVAKDFTASITSFFLRLLYRLSADQFLHMQGLLSGGVLPNLSDLLPVSSIWMGEATAPCPFYPKKSPPLAHVLTTGE